MEKFKLIPKEIIYFDHDKKSVETANKLGILSNHYTDIKSIKKFIEDNLYTIFSAKQKNIDTGMGVERTVAILNNLNDNYLTETWLPIIKEIEKISKKAYKGNEKTMRIIADHIKAAVFILVDGVIPGNKEQGYVLRKLIRRAITYGKEFMDNDFTRKIGEVVIQIYDDYPHLQKNKQNILEELEKEEKKFRQTLAAGLKYFNKVTENKKRLSGKDAFLLFQSYGFPIEIIKDLTKEKKIEVDEKEFEEESKKHQEMSRTATAGKFKSGLADKSEATTKLHTAAHILLQALRVILKDDSIEQRGSNITAERLRLDFSFPRKLTEEEIKNIEDLANAQVESACEVIRKEMPLEQARKQGACGIFDKKYGDKVSVYTIGEFSKEICAGPHVKNTCNIGKIKIQKEESSSSGVRRIKAVVI